MWNRMHLLGQRIGRQVAFYISLLLMRMKRGCALCGKGSTAPAAAELRMRACYAATLLASHCDTASARRRQSLFSTGSLRVEKGSWFKSLNAQARLQCFPGVEFT